MREMLANNRGVTLIELVVTMVILTVLASLILPSAQLTAKRTKEIELRADLREIREAIDTYKKYYDKAVAQGNITPSLNESGYPKDLKELVDGRDFGGLTKYKMKFLRRIPQDPFHPVEGNDAPWGLRSYEDDADSSSWGGEDVFDVRSLSEQTAIDGTKYKDW